MPNVLDQLDKGTRIVIVRLRSLGDCVLTTPALHLLKRHRPDLRVTVVVEPRFHSIFTDNPDIEQILPPSIAAIRQSGPELCLNLHGGTRSLLLTLASGARFRAGFGHYRYQAAYNVRIPRAQEILRLDRKVHTAEHVASAMFHLGVPQCEIPRARLYTRQKSSSTAYAVIHPFASAEAKTWPASRFLEVANHLQTLGIEPRFIGTTADPLHRFRPLQTFTPQLEETKALLAGATLFLGNDSGPAHMAAAFGLPMVVLFAASDAEVWRPWKTKAETIIAGEGIAAVTTQQVLDAIERLRVTA